MKDKVYLSVLLVGTTLPPTTLLVISGSSLFDAADCHQVFLGHSCEPLKIVLLAIP